MDNFTFEVTDLKQWTYCPRLLYYFYCMPNIRPTTKLMELGTKHHQAEEGREERRSLASYGLQEGERVFDLALSSEALGLRGRIDLAIAIPSQVKGREALVVDYKDSEQAAGAHFKLQLAAYALLLEAAWGLPVGRGYIYHIPLRKAEAIALGPALRRKVVDTVATMRNVVVTEQMPDAPSSRARCPQCEFRRFCNDVV